MNIVKNITLFTLLGCISLVSCKSKEKLFVAENIEFSTRQTQLMLKETGEPKGSFPRRTNAEGKIICTDKYDWTSGFFPGNLWYLYDLTGKAEWRDVADRWTAPLKSLQTFKEHHDLGFMMYCSYGNQYRLQPSEQTKQILIESARSLATRFSPLTGTIKSWNYRKAWNDSVEWFYPVIIDNMMNLELLFFASRETGDRKYYDIAVTHANTTLKNHIRPDFSSYHVVNYDTLTGAARNQATNQGYSDNSTWARGQAWGIYGFTLMYRETKDPAYLNAAMRMADWYLNHPNLPSDKIPYWDFNAGQKGYVPEIKSQARTITGTYRDVSAATVVTSALFELCKYIPNKGYYKEAVEMLHTLSSPAYRAKLGENGNFILMHSVGSIPHGAEIDVPLVYADYYFLEALSRYRDSL